MSANRKVASLLVLSAVALALLVSGLQRSHAQGGKASHDFAVGGVTTAQGHTAFAAQLNPNATAPTDATGHVVFQESGGLSHSGPVRCLVVDENSAAIKWEVKQTDKPSIAGTFFTLYVTDNGEPAGLSMDTAEQVHDGDDPGCRQPGSSAAVVLRGNVVVNDAMP